MIVLPELLAGLDVSRAHDLGGMRAFALTLAAGFLGKCNIDMSRFAREQMPPAEYLATTYYEHWMFGLEAAARPRPGSPSGAAGPPMWPSSKAGIYHIWT